MSETLTNLPQPKDEISAAKVYEDTVKANANFNELELTSVKTNSSNYFTEVNTMAALVVANLKFVSSEYVSNVTHQLSFNIPLAILNALNFDVSATLPEITTANIGNIITILAKDLTNDASIKTFDGDILDADSNNKIVLSSLDSFITLMPQKLGKWIILSKNDVVISTEA